jgi:general secretion pathway protein K
MVMALAVLTGLVTILAAAAASQSVAFRAGSNRMEDRRAEIAAEAAAHYVMANLVSQSKTATNLQDDWASLGQNGDERFTIGDAAFRIEILDSASRLNLNSLNQAQLQQLNLTDEQIDSLLDWRQAGQTARANGAKDEYYNTLTEPYNAALRQLRTVDELLLVRGFTAADLFKTIDEQGGNASYKPMGTSTITTTASGTTTTIPVLYDLLTIDSVSQDLGANGQPKLNVNSPAVTLPRLVQAGLAPNIAAAIIQRRASGNPFTSIGQVLALPGVSIQNQATILDNLSITGTARVEGRLNLNTVTEDVLNTVPSITPDIVRGIVQQQATGFTRLGELAAVPGMTSTLLQGMADRFAVNSQTFLVRIVAEVGRTQKAYEATISIEGQAPRIIRMTEAPADAQTRWAWATETTTDTPIVEASSQ